jgi:hypothetical protein
MLRQRHEHDLESPRSGPENTISVDLTLYPTSVGA